MSAALSGTAGLWLAVVLSGLYHGLNPGMGWPLAVSSALFDKSRSALWRAIGALGLGHFIAMIGLLLPFALMIVLIEYERHIRIGAACLVLALGLYLVITQRHPRFLSRVKPNRLALWSFLVALAHGAALMLVPIYLGLCKLEDLDMGHRAAQSLMSENILIALAVAALHTLAMVASGGALAWAVHRYFGLKAISQTWFNLELIWALSLVLVGGLGLWSAL